MERNLLAIEGGFLSQGIPIFLLVYGAAAMALYFTARLLRPDLSPFNWASLALACTVILIGIVENLWMIFS